MIDSNDAQFADLRVWVDANGNGVTDPGELFSLAQLGIISINLNATAVNETIAGNAVNLISTCTLADGTQRTIGDVWFADSATYTKPDTTPALCADVAALPELNGYGSMPELGLIPDTSLSGVRVARAGAIIARRAAKSLLCVSENGTELTSTAILT